MMQERVDPSSRIMLYTMIAYGIVLFSLPVGAYIYLKRAGKSEDAEI